ncbi:ABC transporter substrate-binding protein [Xanthobacter versatilis]|uniref:ABC transporter substrate-binding protein n=1 Tax=Xanthobacter autotrophicus (strain ATCC BAA-1158 / Py2) TaxID=78245 RepID=UPI003728514E
MLSIGRRAFLHWIVASGATLADSALAADLPRHAISQATATPIVIGKQTDDIESLDPHENVSSSAAEIIGNLYETLVTWDPGRQRIAPGLAETWLSSDGGSIWTFGISPGRKFSSGNDVTADDVVFSLQRIITIGSAPSAMLAPLGITSANVKDVVKSEAGKVVIRLPAGAASRLLLHCLTASACSVLDRKVVAEKCSSDAVRAAAAGPGGGGGSGGLCDRGEAWLRSNSAGSGPFWISNAIRTDELVLQRNCHHRAAARARPIVIRNISDPRQQRRLLETGEIQIARNLPDGSWPGDSRDIACNTSCEIPAADKVKKVRHPIQQSPPAGSPKANLLVLCMNVSDYHDNPLRVTAVRQAIRLALDVQSLAEDLNSRRWSPQSGFCPAVLRPSGNAPRHDREKALALLGGEKFTLTIDHVAGSPRSHVVQILMKQLGGIGITLKSRAVSGRQFFAGLKARQYELALLSWNADYLDPHSNAHTFCVNSDIENRNDASTSQTMAWYCRWYDQSIADSANAVAIEADDLERKRKYDEIEMQLLDRGPFAFLLEETDFSFSRQNGPKLSMGVIDSFTRYPIESLQQTEVCLRANPSSAPR